MPSHVHLIFSSAMQKPETILGRFKEHTSKKIIEAIKTNSQESRREWLLWMLKRAANKSSNVKEYQFWQHDNHPIELWTEPVIEQKADYLHDNPVTACFVNEAEHWKYSSAIDYCGGKGLVRVELL